MLSRGDWCGAFVETRQVVSLPRPTVTRLVHPHPRPYDLCRIRLPKGSAVADQPGSMSVVASS
jgi:hypothetical protein